MGKTKPADLLFWSLAAVAAAAFVFFVLVLGGAVPIGPADPAVDDAPPAAAPEPAPTPTPEPEDEEEEPLAAAPPARPESEQPTSTAAETAPQLVTVVVTATRGDCWVAARAGSESGRVLEERVLLQGESVRLRARRVWLSLGASSNVDVLVDQQPREVPAGTVALVLAPSSTS
jgi:hypothetical protein